MISTQTIASSTIVDQEATKSALFKTVSMAARVMPMAPLMDGALAPSPVQMEIQSASVSAWMVRGSLERAVI